MSNLDLKLVKMPVPSNKYEVKCPYAMVPEFLTIHNTANNASALAEISFMIGNWDEVSYHWAVDDVQAIQSIEHNRNGWHSGDGGKGTGNRKSIGIEICHSLTPGNPKYAKSEDNGAKLAAIILHRHGWGIDRIRKHQDWSGKYCPHRILDNGNWEGFKAKVQTYLLQLQGKQTPQPAAAPQPAATATTGGFKEYPETGKFTVTVSDGILFRNDSNLNSPVQGNYGYGESVNYDRVRVYDNGFVWISWVSASTGVRRWMPVRERKNGVSLPAWGTFADDTTATPKPSPAPAPKPAATGGVKEYPETGTFTVTVQDGILFRNDSNLNSPVQGSYNYGESVKYDRVRVYDNGFVWISWISASTGVRRWMPVRERKNGVSLPAWGTFN